MNAKQIGIGWLTGLSIILAILVCSNDYRYFWIGLYAIWAILIIGGILMYISRDKKKENIESFISEYNAKLKVKAVLRIMADILLLSLPVFIVKFIVKDIKNSLKKIKGA